MLRQEEIKNVNLSVFNDLTISKYYLLAKIQEFKEIELCLLTFKKCGLFPKYLIF